VRLWFQIVAVQIEFDAVHQFQVDDDQAGARKTADRFVLVNIASRRRAFNLYGATGGTFGVTYFFAGWRAWWKTV
jgi:hypothetical protein